MKRHKLGALQRAAATYQQRLGLAFERTSGGCMLLSSCTDVASSHFLFSFQ